MQITGKYLKVWKKEVKNGYTKLNLGDSKKQKDGTFKNWTWFGCSLFGKAKDVEIQEKDVVEVKSGIISQRKYKDKWYNDIIIFEIEVMKRPGNQPKQGNFVDDIPF